MPDERWWRRALIATSAMLALAAAAAANHEDVQRSPVQRNEVSARQTVVDRERIAIRAIREGDLKALSGVCLTDFYVISATGEIAPGTKVHSASRDASAVDDAFGEQVVTFPAPGVALLRYRTDAVLATSDRASSSVVLATAVWVIRDGEWKAATYQESAVD
jgi:hypothetical protein